MNAQTLADEIKELHNTVMQDLVREDVSMHIVIVAQVAGKVKHIGAILPVEALPSTPEQRYALVAFVAQNLRKDNPDAEMLAGLLTYTGFLRIADEHGNIDEASKMEAVVTNGFTVDGHIGTIVQPVLRREPYQVADIGAWQPGPMSCVKVYPRGGGERIGYVINHDGSKYLVSFPPDQGGAFDLEELAPYDRQIVLGDIRFTEPSEDERPGPNGLNEAIATGWNYVPPKPSAGVRFEPGVN